MATCFHHPGRETGRACTRCGRPACPECLVQAPVGAHCFECVRAAAPGTAQRLRRRLRAQELVATKLLILVTTAAYVWIGLRDRTFDGLGHTSADLALYSPAVRHGEWWRLFSYSLVHFGWVHILSNLFVLYIVGRVFEPGAGSVRFFTLYVVSVLAGAAGAIIASPHTLTGGASGGVFGVAAAATLVMQRRGFRFMETGLGPLLALNLALGLFISNISLGGHIGGIVGGVVTAEAMMRARKIEMPLLGYAAAVLVALVAVGVAFSVA